IVLPARWAELVRAHDLGADARLVLLGKRVVDAGGPALASQDRGTEAGRHHPLVQPVAGMTERRVEGLALAGREAIQRYGEVVDAGPCHLSLRLLGCFARVQTSADPEIHRSRAEALRLKRVTQLESLGTASCPVSRIAVVSRRPAGALESRRKQ